MAYAYTRDLSMEPSDDEMRAKKDALTHALLETVRLMLDEPESDEDRHTSSPMCRPMSRRATAVSRRTALLTPEDSPREDESSQDEPCDSLQQTFAKRRVQPNPKGGVPGGPCAHCGATESPQWRRPLTKKVILCNACGIYYSRHHAMPKRKKVPTSSRRPCSALELQLDSVDEEGVDEVVQQHLLKRPQPHDHILLLSDVLRPPKRSHRMGVTHQQYDDSLFLHPASYGSVRPWVAALSHSVHVEDDGTAAAVHVHQHQYEAVVVPSTTASHSSGSVLEGDDHFADSTLVGLQGGGGAAGGTAAQLAEQRRYHALSVDSEAMLGGRGSGSSGFVKVCDSPSSGARHHGGGGASVAVTSAREPAARLLPERLATLSGVSQHRLQQRLQQAQVQQLQPGGVVPVLQDLLPASAAAYAATWTPLMRENTARVVAAAASFKAAEAASKERQQQLLRAAEAQQQQQQALPGHLTHGGGQSGHSSPAHVSSQSHMTTSFPPRHHQQQQQASPSSRNTAAAPGHHHHHHQRPAATAATTASSAEHSADSRPSSLVLIPVCSSQGPKRAVSAKPRSGFGLNLPALLQH